MPTDSMVGGTFSRANRDAPPTDARLPPNCWRNAPNRGTLSARPVDRRKELPMKKLLVVPAAVLLLGLAACNPSNPADRAVGGGRAATGGAAGAVTGVVTTPPPPPPGN